MTQEELIFKVTGINPIEGKYYTNPFRQDKRPGCFFRRTGKYLKFYDYAYPEFNGMTCYDFYWYATRGVPLPKDTRPDLFKTLMSEIGKTYGDVPTARSKPKASFKFTLEVELAEWGRKHIDFWKAYGIDKETLEKDNVFPIYSYTHNTKRLPKLLKTKRADYPAFVYKCNGKNKVYQPFGNPKWISQFGRNDVIYWEGKSPTLVLGSYKDARIIANTGQATIALGLENTLPDRLPEDSIIIGDFDKAGNLMKERFVSKGNRAFIWKSPDPDFKDVGELYLKYPEKINSFIRYAIREAIPKKPL